MSEWKECTIAELGEVVGGATPSTKKPKNYENGDISWITPKDLSNFNGRYIVRGERNITEIGLNSCSTRLLPPNTVLFSSRAPIGYVAIAAKEMCTNQGFKSVIPNSDTDYMFLYYLLKYNKNNIENLGSGTTFKEVSSSTMKSIRVRVPVNIDEQRKIGYVLSAIDDKIELNTAINENLEHQAQAIYRKMFLDNTFESWKKGVLSDIAIITMGQSPNGDTFNETGNGTVFYQGCTDFGFRFPTRRLYTTEPKRMAMCGDTLMSVRAPVGDLNTAYEECCIGRGLAAIHSKDSHQSFVLYTLYALKKQFELFNGEGTVFGSINKDSLNSMEIVIPPIELIERFDCIVNPIDRIIRNNYDEICRLQDIRNSLLPKLMNGEIDVSAVKI